MFHDASGNTRAHLRSLCLVCIIQLPHHLALAELRQTFVSEQRQVLVYAKFLPLGMHTLTVPSFALHFVNDLCTVFSHQHGTESHEHHDVMTALPAIILWLTRLIVISIYYT